MIAVIHCEEKEKLLVESEEHSGTKKECVTELFRKYSDEILRMCCLYLKDYQLAEDAVQETYLKVYRYYDSFKGESGRKTWMIRIAINVCKTFLKRKEQGELPYENSVLETNIGAGSASAFQEILENSVVSKAITELSPEIREVILLYYYQELKLKEIAKLLDLPMTTVVYRQQRGKKELKKILGEEKGGLGV